LSLKILIQAPSRKKKAPICVRIEAVCA